MRKTWNAGRSGSGDAPMATRILVIALVACFLGGWFFSAEDSNPFWKYLSYSPDLSMPWTLFTYPFVRGIDAVIWFALACWITYQFLSDLEKRLGLWGTVAFFFSVTFLGGLCYFLGTVVFGPSMILPSLNLPLEFIIFTWCLVNPSAQIMLMMLVPVPTRVLMWLCVAGVVIEYGWGNPYVGFVTALPLPLLWLYATNRIPIMRFGDVPNLAPKQQEKKENKEFDRFMGDVKRREQERAEKERLRKLFESSLSDDDKDKKDG